MLFVYGNTKHQDESDGLRRLKKGRRYVGGWLDDWKGKILGSGTGMLHLRHKAQIVLQALFKRIQNSLDPYGPVADFIFG